MPALVVLSGASRGNHLALDQAAVIVGRDEHADMQVLDERVSRRHFRVAPDGDHYVLEDLSSNGVQINGAAIEQTMQLADNDLIVVGRSQIAFTHQAIGDREHAISFAAHGEHLKRTLDPERG